MAERKSIIEEFNSTKERRARDSQRRLAMSSNITSVLFNEVEKIFAQSRATVLELKERLTPINVFKKIVDKQAKTYLEEPKRKSEKIDPKDDEQINILEEMLMLNLMMQSVESNLVASGRVLIEIMPAPGMFDVSVIESEYYMVHEIGGEIIQVLKAYRIDEFDPAKSRFELWNMTSVETIDGYGNILNSYENVNQIIPFVNVSNVFSKSDSEDRDTLRLSKMIPIICSDISYAIKYQAWSCLLYTSPSPRDS